MRLQNVLVPSPDEFPMNFEWPYVHYLWADPAEEHELFLALHEKYLRPLAPDVRE